MTPPSPLWCVLGGFGGCFSWDCLGFRLESDAVGVVLRFLLSFGLRFMGGLCDPPPSFLKRCFWSSFYEWGLGSVWLGYFFVENCVFLYFHLLALFAGSGSGRCCLQILFRLDPRHCCCRRRGHESGERLFMVLRLCRELSFGCSGHESLDARGYGMVA